MWWAEARKPGTDRPARRAMRGPVRALGLVAALLAATLAAGCTDGGFRPLYGTASLGGADAGRIADGARTAGLPDGSVYLEKDADHATELLRRVLRAGDVVLVKGSRGVGLDRTVEALTGQEAD